MVIDTMVATVADSREVRERYWPRVREEKLSKDKIFGSDRNLARVKEIYR